MGRITVRDLYETAPEAELLIADADRQGAAALARAYRDDRVGATFADATRSRQLTGILRGAFAVVNAVQFELNLHVMQAALAAGCHYIDLGGLFHMTRQQLRLDRPFRQAGLTALLGIGAAPGITNVLARRAAERLDCVTEIHFKLGAHSATRFDAPPVLPVSYSLQTVLQEFALRPAVFTGGRMRFVEPLSGEVDEEFPAPVGRQRPMYTLHSEVATIPRTYRSKGVREVSFRIAFGPEAKAKIRFLRDLGLASEEPVRVGGRPVVPRGLLMALARKLPKPRAKGPLRECEVIRTVVKGEREGDPVVWTLDCVGRGIRRWGVGFDLNTGAPPSIAAQLLARGAIVARGAVPPEVAVPPLPFFRELRRRGMVLRERVVTGGPDARRSVPARALGAG